MRVLLLATPLLLVACGSEPTAEPDVLAQKVAARLTEGGDQALAGTFPGTKVRAHVEDKTTLVLRLENVPTDSPNIGAFEFNDAMRKKFCGKKNFGQLVRLGVRLRIETSTDRGVEMPTAFVGNCDV